MNRHLLRWWLLLQSIPFALAVLGVKLLLNYVGIYGFIEVPEIGVLITASVFLIGFMLSGTLADYKESERIPAELATALETLEENIAVVGKAEHINQQAMKKHILLIGDKIYGWFMKRNSDLEVFELLTQLNGYFIDFEKFGVAPPILVRLENELHQLRRLVTRASVISRTGFLDAGYALLEFLLVGFCLAILAVSFKQTLTEVIIIPLIVTIYFYLYQLIKDIDAPFDYRGREHPPFGSSEVALFPITEYLVRLKSRIVVE